MPQKNKQNYKELSITIDGKLPPTRPRFRTEPNSLNRHPNINYNTKETFQPSLPNIQKSIEKTYCKPLDTSSYYKTEANETQSDKILNQFLMNYFKKKNNHSLRSKRLKKKIVNGAGHEVGKVNGRSLDKRSQ